MAQLSNDCFAVGDRALTIDEALASIAARVAPVAGSEQLPLAACDGRVLAADIHALSPLPAFFNSAVDGYAVCHADLSADGDSRLPVSARLQAGAAPAPLVPGSAVRIFTGAPMPPGADTVYMQEDAVAEDGVVRLPPGLKRGANARPAGEDIAAGTLALRAGAALSPALLALAAGVGHAALPVRRQVRAAIFSTGDELVEPGAPLAGASVYDTNRVMVGALLRRAGCIVSDLGILRDEPNALRAALQEAAAGHDLILTSGGVSTGEADYVKTAVEAEGRLDHWRFAIKPGRPLALGVIGGAAFVGLPGNPVAVFVTFTQIVRAVIAALAGEAYAPPRFLPVTAGFDHAKKTGRIEFLRVSLSDGPEGPVASRYPVEGAGIISSLAAADGIARLPLESKGVSTGDRLDFLPFAALLR
jgi:molybdopterin molybdotransferase